MPVLSKELGNTILTVACASRAFNPQHVQLASDIAEREIRPGHCGDSYAAVAARDGEVTSARISAEVFCSTRCASLSQAWAMPISNILFWGLVALSSAMPRRPSLGRPFVGRGPPQAARQCLLAASALSVLCVIDPDPPLVLFPPLFCAALVLGCPHRVFSPVVNVVLMVYPPTVYCLAARAG